jgi:hypothetical protein
LSAVARGGGAKGTVRVSTSMEKVVARHNRK